MYNTVYNMLNEMSAEQKERGTRSLVDLGLSLDEQPVRTYSHSVKLEETAKGVRISCHVYGNSSEEVRQQILKTYLGVEQDLRNHDVNLAPMIEAKST